MRKWILTALMFMMFACTLGQRPSKPNETAPTNAPTSISIAGNVPTQTPANAQGLPTVTPPPPNPAYPLLTVRMQAIQVSDDDGKRTADITTQQVEQWVNKANEIFANASVRFIYDPNADFAPLKSTLLNNMTGDADPNWAH